MIQTFECAVWKDILWPVNVGRIVEAAIDRKLSELPAGSKVVARTWFRDLECDVLAIDVEVP